MSSVSLNQEQYEKLSDKIFNSTNFAILSSLGLHAVILGGFYGDFSKINPRDTANHLRDVGLVELTPLEQSRLLDFSGETTPTPSTPSTPLIDSSSLPNTSALPPAVPSLDSISPSYSYPTTPALPALPSFPSGQVYAPPLPSIPYQGIRPTQTYPLSLPQLPPPPNNRFQATPLPQVQRPQRPNFGSNRDSLSLGQLRRAPISASEELRNQLQQSNPNTENTEVARVPQPYPVIENSSSSPSYSEIQAQRRQRLVAEMLERSQSLVGDSNNTTNEEAQKNYVAWLNRVKNATPEAISLSGSYPRLACARQLEGTAVYGIVVDGNGAVSSPELIKSAGYPILNNQALRQITSQGFSNPTGQPKPYRVTINYQPNPSVCPTAPVTPPPAVDNSPINTRVNPPVPATPSLPVQPQPQPIQPPANVKPEAPLNQTVKPEVPPIIPTPEKPVEPPAVPESRQPTTPTVEPPAAPASRQPTTPIVEPPAAPAARQPTTSEVEPPAPPTSKKPDTPNLESLNPEN